MIGDTEKIFIAVSLDIYNKKEYIVIYHNKTKISSETRELGKLLFDFSESQNSGLFADYFSNLKVPVLITDDFLEKQRHLSLNAAHKYSSYSILKNYPDNANCELAAGYMQDRLYIATHNNFKSLFQSYLDELYSNGYFPRKCKHCGKLFLARTNFFDVLCFDCRKKSSTDKAERYKENHNDGFEALYMKVYQRWYTRIKRAKLKGKLTGDSLKSCNDTFFRFSEESIIKRSNVKSGDISAIEFEEWIDSFENQLICQFKKYNINISHCYGIEKR